MNTPQKTTTKFVLVRWLSDETVGVMPLFATKDVAHVGRNRMLYSEGSRSKGNSQQCIYNYIRGR